MRPPLRVGGGARAVEVDLDARRTKSRWGTCLTKQTMEIVPLLANDVTALVTTWARFVNDNEPSSIEQESTGDQLSTLRAPVPYADFSVWRPHGARMLRQLKFQAHYPTARGRVAYSRDCPPDVRRMSGVLGFFAFAMEVLQAASRSRLERNATHITKLAGTYAEFGWILAVVDS